MPSSAFCCAHRDLHSFPTRRSSDLSLVYATAATLIALVVGGLSAYAVADARGSRVLDALVLLPLGVSAVMLGLGFLIAFDTAPLDLDRKSTRLNSSHLGISYAVFCFLLRPPRSTLFPYTTLFRSLARLRDRGDPHRARRRRTLGVRGRRRTRLARPRRPRAPAARRLRRHARPRLPDRVRHRAARLRSEEHTSELQSLRHLVCRLLLSAAPTEIYTLSLHDALPISRSSTRPRRPSSRSSSEDSRRTRSPTHAARASSTPSCSCRSASPPSCSASAS